MAALRPLVSAIVAKHLFIVYFSNDIYFEEFENKEVIMTLLLEGRTLDLMFQDR